MRDGGKHETFVDCRLNRPVMPRRRREVNALIPSIERTRIVTFYEFRVAFEERVLLFTKRFGGLGLLFESAIICPRKTPSRRSPYLGRGS